MVKTYFINFNHKTVDFDFIEELWYHSLKRNTFSFNAKPHKAKKNNKNVSGNMPEKKWVDRSRFFFFFFF